LTDRPIFLAQMDKIRPVLVLTRAEVIPFLSDVSVAPITSRMRGTHTEVPVGPPNGLDQTSVVNCDNIQTINQTDLLRPLGLLFPEQEEELAAAIVAAFALEVAL
jgi:mRNA interferase MazF